MKFWKCNFTKKFPFTGMAFLIGKVHTSFNFFPMSRTFIKKMTPCVCYDVCLLMCDVWRPSSAPLFVQVQKQMTQIKSNRWRCKQITDQTHFNFCFRNNDRKWKHSYIPLLFIFVADLFIFYPPFFRNFQTWNLILRIIKQIEHHHPHKLRSNWNN